MRAVCWLLFCLFTALGPVATAQPFTPAIADSLERLLPTLPDTAQARRLTYMAQALFQTNPPQSIEYAHRAQAAARRGHDPVMEGKAITLEALARATMGQDPDSVVALAQQGVALVKQHGTEQDYAAQLNGMGIVYRRTGRTAQGIRVLMESAAIMERVGSPPSNLMQVYANLASNYDDIGDYNKSLMYCLKALPLALEHGQPQNQAGVFNSLGTAYFNTRNYPKALEYYRKAYGLFAEGRHPIGVAGTLMNQAMVYEEMNQLDSVLIMYQEAMLLFRQINDIGGIANAFNNICSTYLKRGQNAEAASAADSAIYYHTVTGNLPHAGRSTSMKAEALRLMGKPTQAVALLRPVLALAEQNGQLDLMLSASENLYKALRDNGNLSDAIAMQERWVGYRDSIRSQENTLEVGRMQGAFETERSIQEAEYQAQLTAALEQESFQRTANLQYIGLFLIVFMLVALAVLARRRGVLARWGTSISFLAVVMLFELVVVFLEPYIQAWSDNLPIGLFVGNLVLALAFTPIHGWITHRLQARREAKPPTPAGGGKDPGQ